MQTIDRMRRDYSLSLARSILRRDEAALARARRRRLRGDVLRAVGVFVGGPAVIWLVATVTGVPFQ